MRVDKKASPGMDSFALPNIEFEQKSALNPAILMP